LFAGGRRISGGATLINPEAEFSPYNTMVTGIDASTVAEAPTFAQVWPSLGALLVSRSVVAHNAAFDLSVLRSSAARYDMTGVSFNAFCTYRMSKAAWPGMESYSLGWLALQLALADFEHHDAGDDATAAGWVAARLCEESGTGRTGC
jgi:DNA polymerase-3 subunit epsilon